MQKSLVYWDKEGTIILEGPEYCPECMIDKVNIVKAKVEGCPRSTEELCGPK